MALRSRRKPKIRPCPACGSHLSRETSDGKRRCLRAGCLEVYSPRSTGSRERDQVQKYGALAGFVRDLPCCVPTCDTHRWRSRPKIDPHHVRTQKTRHGAWIVTDARAVSEWREAYVGETGEQDQPVIGEYQGNLAPLCRACHDFLHDHGVQSFADAHALLEVRIEATVICVPTLAEAARVIGLEAIARECDPLTNEWKGAA